LLSKKTTSTILRIKKIHIIKTKQKILKDEFKKNSPDFLGVS